MHVIRSYWNSLNHNWKRILYKQWLYFVYKKQSLSVFLWDDSYGLDFLLCNLIGIESDNPEDDLISLNAYIDSRINEPDEKILSEIFDMEFITLDTSITFLSPLQNFRNLKIIDFHCTNESKITDFSILRREETIYILDYTDYYLIDFDRYSNIRDIKNLVYIKDYGWPKELNNILNCLSNYKIK